MVYNKNRLSKFVPFLFLIVIIEILINSIMTFGFDEKIVKAETAPVFFQNVAYAFQKDVIKVKSDLLEIIVHSKTLEEITQNEYILNISPRERFTNTCYVEKSILEKKLDNLKVGNIYFDEKNEIAIEIQIEKKIGISDKIYYGIIKPSIHDVLSDYNIPKQMVTLNRENLINFAPGLTDCFINENGNNKNSSEGELETKGVLARLRMDKKNFTAYSRDGDKINVEVDGELELENLQVEAEYNYTGNYSFLPKIKEKMNLHIVTSKNTNKEYILPLFGFNVNAGIGNIYGGIYIVIGIDGSYSLRGEVRQSIDIEAGLEGETFVAEPVSYKKLFKHEKNYSIGDETQNAETGILNTKVEIVFNILGWDLIGSDVIFGKGVSSSIEGRLVTVETYGVLNVNVFINEEKISIINNKDFLKQIKNPIIEGYNVKFFEICAYSNVISGNIVKDKSDIKIGESFVSDIEIWIIQKNGEKKSFKAKVNEKGDFCINRSGNKSIDNNSNSNDYELKKGDIVKIVKVDGKDIEITGVEPTFPFKELTIEYADFFNDKLQGNLNTACTKNQDTGEYKKYSFNEYIECLIEYGDKVEIQYVKCDESGNFNLSYDFKPNQTVSATIKFKGFVILSKNIVKTSTDFGVVEVIEHIENGQYVEKDLQIEKRVQLEHFFVNNLRGEKSLDQKVTFIGNYYLEKINPNNIIKANGNEFIGERTFDNYLRTSGSASSSLSKTFKEELVWGSLVSKNYSPKKNQYAQIISSNYKTSSDALENFRTDNQSYIIPAVYRMKPSYTGAESEIVNFRYYAGRTKPTINTLISKDKVDKFGELGIRDISRKNYLVAEYEDEKIRVADLKDKENISTLNFGQNGIDSGTLILLENIWLKQRKVSDLNNKTVKKILNIDKIDDWAKEAVVVSVESGVMRVNEEGNFHGKKAITRGECAGILSRFFQTSFLQKDPAFLDIPLLYPYKDEIESNYQNGLISGFANGNFEPMGNITREQAAIIITRAIKNNYNGKLCIVTSKMDDYVDSNQINDWAMDAVKEVSALGLMKGNHLGRFNPQNYLTFNEFAVILKNLLNFDS